MPSRNVIKDFVKGGIYHVYNRGVENRPIFMDPLDYSVMMGRMADVLSRNSKKKPQISRLKNHNADVDMLAFSLMPTHYNFLVKIKKKDGLSSFMRTLMTSYSMYFNTKYDRVGSLFQSRYRARRVDSNEYLKHISRYIHLNPSSIDEGYKNYPYSSYKYYLDGAVSVPAWIKQKPILDLFKTREDYEKFIEDSSNDNFPIDQDLINNY